MSCIFLVDRFAEVGGGMGLVDAPARRVRDARGKIITVGGEIGFLPT
jgi:hypothetical protein